MEIHADFQKSNWSKVKNEVKKTWSKLSSNDIEATYGDADKLSQLVKSNYGNEAADFDKKYADIVGRFEDVEMEAQNEPKVPKTVL